MAKALPTPRVERPTPHQFYLAAEQMQSMLDAMTDSGPYNFRMAQSLNQVIAWLHQEGDDYAERRREERRIRSLARKKRGTKHHEPPTTPQRG